MAIPTQNKRKRKRVLWLAIAVALAIGLWFVGTELRNASHPATSSNASPHALASKDASSGTNGFSILSDTLTSTGRVLTVSKQGEQRRLVIPASMAFSPEELAEMAFPPEQPAPEMVPMRTLLNQHLYFYGVAVDEETNALAGAKAVGKVTYMDGKVSRIDTVEATTGPDGRFSLESPWGQMIMISVNKGGYIAPPVQIFQYGPVGSQPRHHPDIGRPVVFVLHKQQSPEPLFAFERRYRIPNTGIPVRVDLTTGLLVSEGGDLMVSIYCPEPYTNLKPFPWKLAVTVVDGGLVEVPSNPSATVRLEQLHQAPTSGFEPGFAVEYGKDTPEFRRQFDGVYYVKSRNGQVYAKMRFDMRTIWDERGIPFGIEAVVNTNASRNLQTPILK